MDFLTRFRQKRFLETFDFEKSRSVDKVTFNAFFSRWESFIFPIYEN